MTSEFFVRKAFDTESSIQYQTVLPSAKLALAKLRFDKVTSQVQKPQIYWM